MLQSKSHHNEFAATLRNTRVDPGPIPSVGDLPWISAWGGYGLRCELADTPIMAGLIEGSGHLHWEGV